MLYWFWNNIEVTIHNTDVVQKLNIVFVSNPMLDLVFLKKTIYTKITINTCKHYI